MVKNLKEYMEIQDSGNKVQKALNAVISSSTRLFFQIRIRVWE